MPLPSAFRKTPKFLSKNIYEKTRPGPPLVSWHTTGCHTATALAPSAPELPLLLWSALPGVLCWCPPPHRRWLICVPAPTRRTWSTPGPSVSSAQQDAVPNPWHCLWEHFLDDELPPPTPPPPPAWGKNNLYQKLLLRNLSLPPPPISYIVYKCLLIIFELLILP